MQQTCNEARQTGMKHIYDFWGGSAGQLRLPNLTLAAVTLTREVHSSYLAPTWYFNYAVVPSTLSLIGTGLPLKP